MNKLTSERYFSILAPEIPIINFRMFNVYGPGQCLIDLKQGMVSIYIAMAIKNSKINIKGSLDRVRDFIYIDDVINFWFEAINLDFYNHHTLNLGTGLGIKISNLVEKIIYADNSKLIDFFGKYNFLGIDEGLERFIKHAYMEK